MSACPPNLQEFDRHPNSLDIPLIKTFFIDIHSLQFITIQKISEFRSTSDPLSIRPP